MKHKLKKWHIALMSFLTLFIAVFASLFSLRADTVDEETGEVLTDNWELGVVFYDSSVDNGKTPLTEINWDASDGGYGKGESRIITVQINYKNTSAVTTYQPGELEITIPNLIYETEDSSSVLWTSSVAVGANDQTHTGYDWNFSTGSAPTINQKTFNFTNAITIEEKTNFEGSIQIVYTITPNSETPEKYEDQCIHNLSKSLQATLAPKGIKIITELTMNNIESTINSPNWPKNYNNNMSQSTNYWEYTSDSLENLVVYFDKTSSLENKYDKIYIYNKTGTCLYTLTGTEMAEKTFEVDGNYVKIAMSSDSSGTRKGFSASIGNDVKTTTIIPDEMILSNELEFNYTRTYIHPWQKIQYTIIKSATQSTSYDQIPSGYNADDYYWVNYTFKIEGYQEDKYPFINAKESYILDVFPENCIVFDDTLKIMSPEENNIYKINISYIPPSSTYVKYTTKSIYVGYPVEIYNNINNNLIIKNSADLYGKYLNSTKYTYQDTDDITINLSEYKLSYNGELYSITKTNNYGNAQYYYQDFINNSNFIGTSSFNWKVQFETKYTGETQDIKFGDDLMYVTSSSGNYRKLNDNEYYFSSITFPHIYNGLFKTLNEVYDVELWVRYANSSQYELYSTFKNKSHTISFPENNVVECYFIIKNVTSDIRAQNAYFTMKYNNMTNLATSGNFYNFCYLEVYSNEILQNSVDLSSYETYITQNDIANYDLLTYGHYVQRALAVQNYKFYNTSQPKVTLNTEKSFTTTATQDENNERFYGTINLKLEARADGANINYSNNNLVKKMYLDYLDNFKAITSFKIYDLLPEGMNIKSTSSDILTSIYNTTNGYYCFYNKDGTLAFQNYNELITFFRNHSSIKIEENWNNTNRTKLTWIIDFSDNPLIYIGSTSYHLGLNIKYDWEISYDNLLEFGNVWTNYDYVEGNYNNNTKLAVSGTYFSKSTKDNLDLNEDGNTTDYLGYDYDSITITSVVSTHQDVTTYVKTDQSNCSTGIVDTSCNSEYEYKLRVRTGSADVTNLVIYTSIEEAQPDRTRWYGEFLGIDTTYAENKGYTVKVWYSPNKTVGTLAEDNSWLEYTDSTNKNDVKSLAFQYLDSNGIAAKLPTNSLTYVLIKMKSPADENIKTLARMDCWTQWNALDDYDRPVDFITGINSNVVKVALPNSIKTDDMPSISLKFIKEITGTETQFKNMLLNKADPQTFMIRLTSLTANDDGTYNQVTALLKSDQELIISKIPIGTYLLEELGDNYFDFVEFIENNEEDIIVEGVTFERTDQGYIITVSENLIENVEFNIQVINEIEPERFYEDKENKENLFLKNKIEEDSV